MSNAVYNLQMPLGKKVPLLLSSPHSGVKIPADIASVMNPSLARTVPDTDFFVDELYGFGPQVGITMIDATHSRYVIDLNRDATGSRLYSDDRKETSLVPLHSFAGVPIYTSPLPCTKEIARRIKQYYTPYYKAIEEQLASLKAQFGYAIFWDCHSIKRQVPAIRPEPFPDVILGNQDGKTCHPDLFQTAGDELRKAGWQTAFNHPFKGGNLTRHFGRPRDGIHAIQLEMSQDLYMDDITNSRDSQKQDKVAAVLRTTLEKLIEEASRCLT